MFRLQRYRKRSTQNCVKYLLKCFNLSFWLCAARNRQWL
jgi:hypothetical protein